MTPLVMFLAFRFILKQIKKKKLKKIRTYRASVQKETTGKRCSLIIDLKPLR